MLIDLIKFVMNACFLLAAKRMFNVHLEMSTFGESFVAVYDETPLVRMNSSIDNFCNSITLNNHVNYISRAHLASISVEYI